MWIDINERMPPEDEDVLIVYDCCGEPDIDIMKRSAVDGYDNHFRNKRGFLTGDVTHWMPIYPLPHVYPVTTARSADK